MIWSVSPPWIAFSNVIAVGWASFLFYVCLLNHPYFGNNSINLEDTRQFVKSSKSHKVSNVSNTFFGEQHMYLIWCNLVVPKSLCTPWSLSLNFLAVYTKMIWLSLWCGLWRISLCFTARVNVLRGACSGRKQQSKIHIAALHSILLIKNQFFRQIYSRPHMSGIVKGFTKLWVTTMNVCIVHAPIY